MTPAQEVRVYLIPEQNLEELQQRIGKLSRRGRKIDANNLPHITTHGYEDKPVYKTGEQGKNVISHYQRYIHVILDGVAPVIDGWDLIAVIDHTTDSEVGNIVRTVPGKECPVRFRTCQPYCEHCKTSRRRNETFVLWKNWKYRQVGRNCLADFCRNPERADELCSWAEYMAALGELLSHAEESSGGDRRIPLDSVLKATSKVIRLMGWMSKAKARLLYERDGRSVLATADVVMGAFFNNDFLNIDQYSNQEHRDFVRRWKEDDKGDLDAELADKALAWVRQHLEGDRDQLSEYMHNLTVVCTQETLQSNEFGLACSAIASYQREMDKKSSKVASKHFGEIKDRDTWDATITGFRAFNGYGYNRTKYLVSFMVGTDQGIWWSSGSACLPEIGDKVRITGTVKAHNVYRNTKQTELTRCKILVPQPQPNPNSTMPQSTNSTMPQSTNSTMPQSTNSTMPQSTIT